MILPLCQQIKGGGNSVNTAKIKMNNQETISVAILASAKKEFNLIMGVDQLDAVDKQLAFDEYISEFKEAFEVISDFRFSHKEAKDAMWHWVEEINEE
jgi:hypothetical protein